MNTNKLLLLLLLLLLPRERERERESFIKNLNNVHTKNLIMNSEACQ